MTKAKVFQKGPTAYHDLGFKNADEMALKSRLVYRLAQHIEEEGLTITTAAKRLGIGQPDLSNVLRGRFEKYSVMTLMRFLAIFGEKVDIRLQRKGEKKPLSISVSA